MTGANNGRSPKLRKQEETEQGAHVTYLDFPVSKEYDDVYQLQVKASDLAGNQAEQTMTFSINRFGSVYDLSEDTKKGLEKYYLKQAQPITFYETNIDYVGESEIFCRRDGSLVQLKRGQDYQVSMQGSSDSWKQYQYVIPAEYFDREGVYELQLSSTDRANNQSDTGIQQKRVVFVLDRTAPGCTITGVKSGTVYERETLTVCIAPYDNFGVAQMKIYADSELLKSSQMKDQENIKLTMRAKHQWQTLQIYICDQAGNEYWSEEIPFYIKADDIEVEPYEKVRESAEEKEMRKKLEAVSFLNGSSFSLVRQMDPILLKKTMSEEAATEKEDEIARNAAEPEEKIQQEQSEKETKAGFLAVGAVVFLVTVVVLFVDIFRQLWYDAP